MPGSIRLFVNIAEVSLRKGLCMTARVMVINDDQAILDLYRLLLEGEGYETHLSMIAIEDVRKIKELAPDCIILDLKLGFGRNGMTLLQQLKMYRPTADIPSNFVYSGNKNGQRARGHSQATRHPRRLQAFRCR